MEEFLTKEGNDDGQFPIPEQNRTKIMNASVGCDKRAKSMCIESNCALYVNMKLFVFI